MSPTPWRPRTRRATERDCYTRALESLIQVGDRRSDLHARALGHLIELVLLDDPAGLDARRNPFEHGRAEIMTHLILIDDGNDRRHPQPERHLFGDKDGVLDRHFDPLLRLRSTLRTEGQNETSRQPYPSSAQQARHLPHTHK